MVRELVIDGTEFTKFKYLDNQLGRAAWRTMAVLVIMIMLPQLFDGRVREEGLRWRSSRQLCEATVVSHQATVLGIVQLTESLMLGRALCVAYDLDAARTLE
jgi:hypothetical protein